MSPLEDFRGERHTRGRGRSGEDDGVRWLEARGFRIVARNVRLRIGELDVIAREGDTLCFVEIKARATVAFGGAVEAVTAAKQRQIAGAAALFLASHPHPGPCRFDVLAMDACRDGWRYTLIRDAFEAGSA